MASNNGHAERKDDKSEAAEESTRPRTKLPVPQPDRSNINLWSFLKTCIGKELSKITMPVEWNEPISLLQRLVNFHDPIIYVKGGTLEHAFVS